MTVKLDLTFQTPQTYTVKYDDRQTDVLAFENPITQDDYGDIRWYLETYAARHTSDPDDDRASGIEKKLEEWGEKLFRAVFEKQHGLGIPGTVK